MTNVAGVGLQSGTATLNFVSDGSGTSYLGTTPVGSQVVTVEAYVFNGLAAWTGSAGTGNWSDFGNWSSSGGTPGLAGSPQRRQRHGDLRHRPAATSACRAASWSSSTR